MKRKFWLLAGMGAGFWLWRRNREQQNAIPVKNKVVIITGASAGIGRATAHVFAAQGAHVVLVARRAEVLAEVQDELRQYGVQTLSIPADVSRIDDTQQIVDATLETFGKIDVLVNNAGLSMGGWLEAQSPEAIARMVNVNVTGLMHLTQQVIPIMKRQHSGYIVNISSVAGLIHSPGQSSYAATKAAVNSFSEALRRELKPDGINVSVVMPGWTQTDMIADLDRKKMRNMGMIPPFMMIDSPEKVAKAIVNTVIYNRQRVQMGGIGFTMGDYTQRFAPWWMDIIYQVTGVDRMVDLQSELG